MLISYYHPFERGVFLYNNLLLYKIDVMKKIENKAKQKAIRPVWDIAKLPERYFFSNQENLTENKYIDDNSLFVCYLISRGLFSFDKEKKLDAGAIFLYFHPFE